MLLVKQLNNFLARLLCTIFHIAMYDPQVLSQLLINYYFALIRIPCQSFIVIVTVLMSEVTFGSHKDGAMS